MGVIEFELTRTVHAGIQDVFARLADIDGHNDWMPKKGSMLRRTRQTSPGAPALGTTYLDETSAGPTPGEIAEFQPPHTLVYHWWDRSKAGKLKLEGWPAYRLEAGEAAPRSCVTAPGCTRTGCIGWPLPCSAGSR